MTAAVALLVGLTVAWAVVGRWRRRTVTLRMSDAWLRDHHGGHYLD